MSLERLLNRRVDVYRPAGTVVDGRATHDRTLTQAAVKVRIVERSVGDVIYDPAGEIVADADVITRWEPLEIGDELDEDGGLSWVITGRPVRRTRADTDVAFLTAPARLNP